MTGIWKDNETLEKDLGSVGHNLLASSKLTSKDCDRAARDLLPLLMSGEVAV